MIIAYSWFKMNQINLKILSGFEFGFTPIDAAAPAINHLAQSIDKLDHTHRIIRMDQKPLSFSNVRVPTVVWVLIAAVLIAGIAIFIFNVPLGTVVTYGLFGFMMLSHLFMHGNHGSHENHSENNTIQNGGSADQKANDHPGNKGGCH